MRSNNETETAERNDTDNERVQKGIKWKDAEGVSGREKKSRNQIWLISIVITSSIQSLTISPHLFFLMPKDTWNARKYLSNEIILMILQLADEDMLRKSGNAVYLRIKRELDDIWWGFFFKIEKD